MQNLVSYARKVEGDMFNAAGSRVSVMFKQEFSLNLLTFFYMEHFVFVWKTLAFRYNDSNWGDSLEPLGIKPLWSMGGGPLIGPPWQRKALVSLMFGPLITEGSVMMSRNLFNSSSLEFVFWNIQLIISKWRIKFEKVFKNVAFVLNKLGINLKPNIC